MTRILITGATGMVGQAFLQELADTDHAVTATDIRPPPALPRNASFAMMDVRGDDIGRIIGDAKPDVVVHLASIVTPDKESTRDFAYDVDVNGTQNVLDACLTHDVERLVVTSSGAAYGYHPENCDPLTEEHPIRGNMEFAYSYHKRLVEEMLAKARIEHPRLTQVILRVGTVLDAGVDNQITALFKQKRLLRIAGSEGAFVFIWTQDLARILTYASLDSPSGIYNVAGDGALPVADLAAMMNKSVMTLPAGLIKTALRVAKPLGLSRYGPEQVRFLQYRPVLDNTKLKNVFGYVPEKTSAETFALWWEGART